MATLGELRPGERGRVTEVQGNDAIAQRLMEMGLFEGEEIEVVGFAPLGDPIEIRLHDYCLSLRKSEATRVQITPL